MSDTDFESYKALVRILLYQQKTGMQMLKGDAITHMEWLWDELDDKERAEADTYTEGLKALYRV